MGMRVVGLWVLATWCAECVWGGFTVVEYPLVLLFLGPLYGSVAVLIREVARRRGGGWPAMVLLAAAFGLVQAGLVDQSLFDREALAGTEFAGWNVEAAATLVPGLGFSAEQLFDFVGNHVWLSVCAPIAVVEACVAPERRRAPWLGRPAVVALVVLYVVGSLLIWFDSGRVVSVVQAGFVVVVAGVLVVAALVWRPSPPSSGRCVHPLVVGGVVLVAHVVAWFFGSQWLGVGLRVATVVLVAVVVVRWVGSARHVVAAWGGGLVAAAGAALLNPPYQAASPGLMLVSDVFGVVLVVSLLMVAYWRAGVGVGGPVRGRVLG